MLYGQLLTLLTAVVAALHGALPTSRSGHQLCARVMMEMAFSQVYGSFSPEAAGSLLSYMYTMEQNTMAAHVAPMPSWDAANYYREIEASSAYLVGFKIQPTHHRGQSAEHIIADMLTSVSIVVKRVRVDACCDCCECLTLSHVPSTNTMLLPPLFPCPTGQRSLHMPHVCQVCQRCQGRGGRRTRVHCSAGAALWYGSFPGKQAQYIIFPSTSLSVIRMALSGSLHAYTHPCRHPHGHSLHHCLYNFHRHQ